MGNSNEKEILDTISSPENETALRALFQQFDKNKSGSLDKKEWAVFGKYLYKADVEKPLKEGEKDLTAQQNESVRAAMQQANLPFQGFVGINSAANNRRAHALSELVRPKDVDDWIDKMFVKADKDKGGEISFEEFVNFLRVESKQEQQTQKANLMNAANDPNANFQARNGMRNPRYDPFGIAGKMDDAVTAHVYANQQDGLLKDVHSTTPYQAGQVNVVTMHYIQRHPGMKAQYAANPELVRQLCLHEQDGAATKQLLDANPSLKNDWMDMQLAIKAGQLPQPEHQMPANGMFAGGIPGVY